MKPRSIAFRRHTLPVLAAVAVLALASVAAAQTLFVSCFGEIDKITPDGTVTTFVSGLSSTMQGLAFDSSGNLYAANQGGGSIYKITPGGVVTTFVSGLSSPIGLAFDGSGNLYVANFTDGNIGTVAKITPDGSSVSTFADNGMSAPLGLAFDGSGNLYATKANYKIVKLPPNNAGSSGTNIVNSGLFSPCGLAFNSRDNNLYTGNVVGTIYKVTLDGTVSTFVTIGGNAYLVGLACDSSGNLYAAIGSGGTTIDKITPDGTVTTFASGLNRPSFIAIQPQSAATGAISGTVANGASSPIQGAAVSLVVGGTTYSATSAANGTYEIDSVPAGTGYTMTASATGYASGTAVGVTVTAGNTTANVNITLAVSFASWAATYPGIGGPTADPDNDGIPNLLEYAFNLNPLVPDRSGLPVVGTITSGGSQYLTVTYTAQPLAGDLTYSVQASTDMVTWAAITTPAAATVSPVTVQDPTPLDPGIRRFLRVVVVGP